MLNTLDDIVDSLLAKDLQEHRQPHLELKRSWSQENGQKISMLANRSADGFRWLVIGVSDDGSLAGYSEDWAKQTEEIIAQHLNRFLEPTQACTRVVPRDVDGEWIIILEVVNPGAVVRWNQKAYKGAGTAKDEMRPEEVMALQVSLPGLQDYSAQNAGDDSFAPGLVQEYAKGLQRRVHEPDWAQVATESADGLLGRLKIRSTQTRKLLFGNAKFRVAQFDAESGLIRNETRSGLLSLLTQEFRDEIQSQQVSGALAQQYPDRALREALANAVAHAAYFQNDGEIIIEIHPEQLSISNLCLPQSLFFANKWFSRSHNTVNALLMETLRLGGFVDELGRGKSLIMAEVLRAGQRPPLVLTESAGQYNRWKLILFGEATDQRLIRLLERLREHYQDEKKALLANALVHWRDQPFSALKKYVDDESLELFAEVLVDPSGPIVLDEQSDRLETKRWVSVLLEAGRDSRSLSEAEERSIQNLLRARASGNRDEFKPLELRQAAGMGNTHAERVLASNTLKKWKDAGIVRSVRHGVYGFLPDANALALMNMKYLLDDARQRLSELLSKDLSGPLLLQAIDDRKLPRRKP